MARLADDHGTPPQRLVRRRAFLKAAGAGALGVGSIALWSDRGRATALHQESASPAPLPTSRVRGTPQLLVSGYNSPEGPAFDRLGNLFFVNWLSSSIIRITPDGRAEEWFNTGGIPAGLAFHPDGSLYVADEGADIHGVMRITPDKQIEMLVDAYEGTPLNGANDLVFDRDGVLYFTDPWTSWVDNPVGGFYRLHPDGSLEQLDTGLAFPNGVALALDGTAVFVAETGYNRIHRYSISASGDVGPREEWATLDPAPGGPDGMEFDENGDLYVAHYGTGHVDVLNPSGVTVEQITFPGRELTNVAFGGPENRTLVVTDVETGALYSLPLNVAGQPLHDGRAG